MGRRILIYIFLTSILIVGSFLRFYKLGFAPPSANWDEAAFGYNAFSIWTTGRDEYGTLFPSSFRSFDDYKPPLYVYAAAPIVGIFGLNEFNIRLLSAISGVLSILLIFVLTTNLSRKSSVGLLAALILATAPWAVHFSRITFEAQLGLPIFLCGLIYLLKQKRAAILWGLFLIMISAFAYNSYKVYFGIAFLYVIAKMKKDLLNKTNLLACVVIGLPLFLTSIFTPALARFSGTSIFPLLVNTKSIYLAVGEVVNRYVAYFAPANIFVRGSNEPNQQIAQFGLYFSFMFVFWLIGMLHVFKRRHQYKSFWFWLLISPLPAVLTWNWVSPIRVLPFLVLMAIVIALGIDQFLKIKRIKYIAEAVIFGWWVVSTIWLHQQVTYAMPYTEYGKWQWGFREVMQTIEPILDNYDQVVWETPQAQPYIFVLFYSSYPAAKYHNEIDSTTKSGGPRKIYDFGKFTFRKIYWPTDRDTKRTLYIGDPFSLPSSDILRDKVKDLHDIYSPEEYIMYRVAGT